MTAEQYRIINYHLQPGEVVKVMALAGEPLNVAVIVIVYIIDNSPSMILYVLG